MYDSLRFQGLKDRLIGRVPEISLQVKRTFNVKFTLLLCVAKMRRRGSTFERINGRVKGDGRRGSRRVLRVNRYRGKGNALPVVLCAFMRWHNEERRV